jgi:BASS family bile acid:Na+ symporter
MFALFRGVVAVAVPAFVISTMLNVGLTQKPSTILGYLRDWPFVLRMVAANFIAVPLVMILILRITSFSPVVQAGLLVFSLGAGAPFLIKLTQMAEHDVALGAAVMMLLTLATIAYMPLVLPRFLEGGGVDAGAIAGTLLRQMLLPIVIGALVVEFLRGFAHAIQPWVAKLSNIALYVVIVATFIGYFPSLVAIIASGALLAALVFVLAAFGLGYVAGLGKDHLEDIGALGTAQRNTAAGLIVTMQNFDDPRVLVVLTLANTVGLVLLIFLARLLSRDNPAHAATV